MNPNAETILDPAESWKPWQPTAAEPWGRKWAAHLYRRAGFGASREELLEAERRGLEATLELLFNGRSNSAETLQTLTDVGRVAASRDDEGAQLRSWWLYAMLQGGFPLREKLTLFWHNHFATSMAKVRSPQLMFRQNVLLRTHALGRFGPFLQAMSQDGAMLLWLDSNSNVKSRPNENFAREVMELFSLGVGNYTEKDIREAARAFTGWHTDGEGFRFISREHDTGSKVVLGQTGNWDGGDVVRIILQQPGCARFLVAKLYSYFVSESPPPANLLEPLCDSFRASGYDIAKLLRTMLSSRHFFSAQAFRKRIKSPVEFVLGAVRAVYREFFESDPDYQPLPHWVLVRRISAMGQVLFAPPNVKGWPGGRAWLNTSTILERANFATALTNRSLWSEPPSGPILSAVTSFPLGVYAHRSASPAANWSANSDSLGKAFDPARLLREVELDQPEAIIERLLDLYVPGGVRLEARAKLKEFLEAGKPVGRALEERVRETVHAIMTMPEYLLA